MSGEGVRIAIVGATGLVGRTALAILEGRSWVADAPLLQASAPTSERLPFRGSALGVQAVEPTRLQGLDAVLLCGGEELGRSLAPPLSARGVVVIDLSPAWRMAPDVPLVVAPVNLRRLQTDPPVNLLANPNCTAAIVATALGPLVQRCGARRVAVASYQSASGGGRELLAELDQPPPPPGQARSLSERAPAGVGLRENVVPLIGPLHDGESLEERKIVDELRKILALDGTAISATAVRVPTRVGHGAAVTLWPQRDLDPRAAAALLRLAAGVEFWADDDGRPPPTARDAAGRDPVLVGRLRRPAGDPEALVLWVVGDNLRRGGALNAIELLEARLGARGAKVSPDEASAAAGLVARIVLAYDGTDFHGWQVQPGQRTVQGELGAALGRLVPMDGPPPGAGRTDAGVHARGQVASLPVVDAAALARIARALPRMVPDDMAVLEVTGQPPGFHARFSATGRRYAYRFLRRADPLRRREHWLVHEALDVQAMRAAAALLIGEHDCTSFCLAASVEPGRMLCRIRRAELVAGAGEDVLTLTMEADRFVHSMVRAVAGTLVEVGRGRRTPESISTILLARDRRAAGVAAPPHGLCLERVEYQS